MALRPGVVVRMMGHSPTGAAGITITARLQVRGRARRGGEGTDTMPRHLKHEGQNRSVNDSPVNLNSAYIYVPKLCSTANDFYHQPREM